jgi:hypothetical protein
MSSEARVGKRKRMSWLALLGAGVMVIAIGPCPSLQFPPYNTESIWGVAIARGEEVPPARQIDADVASMPDKTPCFTD